MTPRNASDESFEKFGNQRFDVLKVADFQDFEHIRQEHHLYCRYYTSVPLFPNGQYFKRPSTRIIAN